MRRRIGMQSPRRARACLAVVVLVAVAPGCALHVAAPELSPADIESTLFLIGDAGEPDPQEVGVPLDSLYAQAALAPERSLILFLGDNVYPAGVPETPNALWADARRRLAAQIAAVPPGARGIFVPGNHDWADEGPFGLYSVRLQEDMIAALAEGREIRLLPENGCPGPVALDIGRLRLVLLDTQWWLHEYIVRDAESDCVTEISGIMAALRAQIQPGGDNRVVLVAAHHPLMTGGEHGGYCGIAGPFHRFGGRRQDIVSSANRTMRDSLESAFAVRPPLAYLAGHEHNLQVLRGGEAAAYLLVSGAGSQSKASCSVRLRESYYVSQHRTGFMRLDIIRGGGVLLRVYRYRGDGSGGLSYTRWLEPRP